MSNTNWTVMEQDAIAQNYRLPSFPSQPNALAFEFNTAQVSKSQFMLEICLYKACSFMAQECIKKVKLSLCLTN
jgi:hypothetical protein